MTPKSAKICKSRQEPAESGRNATATKERILNAARSLFSQDIYKNVGTRDIAALAGVNINLINRYFGSKKELYRAVVMSSWQTPAPQEAPREQAYQALVEFLAEPSSPRKQTMRLILTSIMDSQVADIISEFVLSRLRVQASVLPGGNKEAKAALIFAAVAGTALVFPLIREQAMNTEAAEMYSRQYFNAMLDYLFTESDV